MESHVKILGTLHIVFGALGIVVASASCSCSQHRQLWSASPAPPAPAMRPSPSPILGGIGTISFWC